MKRRTRPSNGCARSSGSSTLSKPDIDARVIDCDPHLADTAQFVEAYGYTLGQSANTLIVIGKSDPPVYVACVVLANTRLDVNKVVRQEARCEEVLVRPG